MTKFMTTLSMIVVLSAYSGKSYADPIYTPVVSPVTPSEGNVVPKVESVPGKRFTDMGDMDYNPIPHALSPSQIGEFDGIGGARNGLRLGDFETQLGEYHIDAQSQVNDALFDSVINNKVPLIVSTTGDNMLGSNVSLAAETPTGATQSFATSTQIVNHPHPGGQLNDIDSVDMWGLEGLQAAGFYSFEGDTTGVSIYSNLLLGPGGVAPYLTQADIAGAIGQTNLVPFIDVDALMVRDIGEGLNPFDGTFGPGDAIMFSLAPVTVPGGPVIDGGEIWVWEFGLPAVFLDHGGHIWDTAHSVSSRFDTQFENVDALEAAGVPEPTTCVLGAMAAVAICCTRFTRKRA